MAKSPPYARAARSCLRRELSPTLVARIGPGSLIGISILCGGFSFVIRRAVDSLMPCARVSQDKVAQIVGRSSC